MTKYLWPVAFLWIFQSLGLSQSIAGDSVYYRMDSVIVSASRYDQPLEKTPFPVKLINPGSPRIPGESLSIKDLFYFVPGISVDNRYNLSEGDRISIRGIGSRSQFGVRGIMILLDGIPLTFPDGQSQLNNLDINSIGKMEIIRGPSSFLYGNSSGGVIEIQSKHIFSQKLKLIPSFRIGSFGFQKYSVVGAGRMGNNSLSVSFNKINSSGFRENSAASSTALNIISAQQFKDNISIEGIFNYYNAPYLLNPSSLTKSDAKNNPTLARTFVKEQGAGKDVKQGQAGMTFTYKPDNYHKLRATLYGISRSMLNPIPGRYINLNRISGGFRTDYSYSFFISKINFNLLAGGDYEFQNDLRKEYANKGLNNYSSLGKEDIIKNVSLGNILLNQREKVGGAGVFARLGFSPLDKIYLSFGLRYDNYNFSVNDYLKAGGIDNSGSRKMSNISRMAGINYNISTYAQLYADYSTSFQTPTTTELSNSPSGQGGFNPSLNPELIQSYEAGIRGRFLNRNITYGVSVYRLIIDKMLISYQLPNSQSDQVFYRNTGGAVNNGVGINFNWKPVNSWMLSVAYTYMNFKFKNFTEYFQVQNKSMPVQIGGKYVPGVSPDNIDVGLTYFSGFGLTAAFSLNRTDKYFVNDLNGPEPGSTLSLSDYINYAYTTGNFKLSYNREFGPINAEIFAGILNLFDARYNGSVVPNAAGGRFFEPAAPRNWYGGISLTF